MLVEVIFGIIAMGAVLTLVWQTRTGNLPARGLRAVSTGLSSERYAGPKICPLSLHQDVLDDYAQQLQLNLDDIESAAHHHLLLADHLLQEAEYETARLELLIDKLGYQLGPLVKAKSVQHALV